MTKENPFPGMNPFLERHWSDVHSNLISYVRDAIAESLPAELKARSKERVTLHDAEEKDIHLRADVAVVESWKSGVPPQWEPEAKREDGIVATAPRIVLVSEETERWIEISDANGKLVTVIEVLSPAKKGTNRQDYIERRNTYVNARVNLVEIDLLRGGRHSLVVPSSALGKTAGTHYVTCVYRAPSTTQLEVYETSLREPLPNISIPLRTHDADVVLALQPLVNRCHRMGAYWSADYRNVPEPELPGDDAAWVNEQIREAGLAA